MNVAKIKANLQSFIRSHNRQFSKLASREPGLLEMGALLVASEHYRLFGYQVTPVNADGGIFRVKLSARGHPYNFSWFSCTRGDVSVEIHSNLAVEGAQGDDSIYVVDVAVAKAGHVPSEKPSRPWRRLENRNLITFAEVKSLVVYPMLLAQFVGIVHEIKPKLLRGPAYGFSKYNHFHPALISRGYLKGTSRNIIVGFTRRNFKICVVASFDEWLSNMRGGTATESPFQKNLPAV